MKESVLTIFTLIAIFVMAVYIFGSVICYFFDDFYPPTPEDVAKKDARRLIRRTNVYLFWRRVCRFFKRRNHV